MLFNTIRRPSRLVRRKIRLALSILCGIFVIDCWNILVFHSPLIRIAPARPLRESRIFIAATHRNTEFILRTHWNEAVLNLTNHFGPKNVFVSIQESGSMDDTKGALRDLDFQLKESGVHRSIKPGLTMEQQLEEIAHAPEREQDGWIRTSRDKIEIRRIPYLAKLRNKVMEALETEFSLGRKYDIVLWLNDVIFTTEDIVNLLETRNGQYDTVCSLDFKEPSIYYDTFALRDSSGQKALPQTWPYFLSKASRKALMANQPVPVQSCWNGAVAFKADPFYASAPPRFRGIPDSLAKHHLEGSECCLIHQDYARAGKNERQGVWVNPNVRVGYSREAYEAVNPIYDDWPGAWERLSGIWENRLARWLGWGRRNSEGWKVKRTVQKWERENEGNHEDGVDCIINEMQVLFESGWMHV